MPAGTRRIDGIDFWRGFVLLTIFVSHIPGNVLGYATVRNFAFSDAAEAFVFLSGVAVALAYGRRFTADKVAASSGLWSRALQLYVVHIGLTLTGMVLFAVAYMETGNQAFLLDDGRDLPLLRPLRGLLGIVSLGHQPGWFNILPLYVVLLLATPGFLALAARSRLALLAASVALYAVARLGGLQIPSWPTAQGGFYFNPFTWQLIYVIGLLTGGTIRERTIPYHPVVFASSLAVSLVSAVIVSNAFGQMPGLVDAAGLYLDWDKSTLGLVRLTNFLCLAYVVYHAGLTDLLRRTPVYAPLALVGRHGLAVFCAGTLLSSAAWIVTESLPRSIAFDVGIVLLGFVILHALATLIEWHGRPRPNSESVQRPSRSPS